MRSVTLGAGVISAPASVWVPDRIGGGRTLPLGSGRQALALVPFLPFGGLVLLFALSAIFRLALDGITPSDALFGRERFAPKEAGVRVGTVPWAPLLGLALGRWMSGANFGLVGSCEATLATGLAWSAINASIAAWLLRRAAPLSAT